MLDRTQQPAIQPISNIPFPNIEKSSLSNGIPLHIIRDDSQEVVRLDFMFTCGSWHQSKPLVSFLTNQLLKEGTTNLSSQQIAEKLDFYGSSLQLSSSYHYSYLTVYSLTKYVAETLAVLEEILKYPSFPKAEFEILLNKRRQHFLLDEEKVQVLASKKFSACVYGNNHPYGKVAVLQDFDQVSIDDLKAFYNTHYSLSNCQIIISGNAQESLMSQLSQSFGKEPLPKQITKELPYQLTPSNEKIHHISKTNTVQAAVRIGRVGIQCNHPDFHAMKVVSTILGGYFGSRLMSSIREEKGYTYGIGSSLSAMRDGGTFCITTETATEYVKPLIVEVYKEMDRLCSELIGDQELTMVKNFMLGDAARLFDGTFSMADICISLLANKMDLSFYKNQLKTIREIGPQQIQNLAQKYFQKDAFYEIVAG